MLDGEARDRCTSVYLVDRCARVHLHRCLDVVLELGQLKHLIFHLELSLMGSMRYLVGSCEFQLRDGLKGMNEHIYFMDACTHLCVSASEQEHTELISIVSCNKVLKHTCFKHPHSWDCTHASPAAAVYRVHVRHMLFSPLLHHRVLACHAL